VAAADVDRRTAEATARRLGGRGLALHMDVASRTSVDDGFAALDNRWGRVDIAVTNAAIEPIVPFLELDEATWDRIVDTNLKGTFLVAQAAARRMVRRRAGVIITLSSVNAEVARPESAAYAATKGGVRQLTKAMAIALAPHGIRVNAIGPGTVVTGLTRHLLRNRAWRDAVYARTPMQRVADPREIAEVAVFLASDMSSYMTGSTVYVDGGRLALNGLMPPRRGR
jgi:NAD(P)-dependent dehydrogenase (short-subunit alcohol dehydrogenase family)